MRGGQRRKYQTPTQIACDTLCNGRCIVQAPVRHTHIAHCHIDIHQFAYLLQCLNERLSASSHRIDRFGSGAASQQSNTRPAANGCHCKLSGRREAAIHCSDWFGGSFIPPHHSQICRQRRYLLKAQSPFVIRYNFNPGIANRFGHCDSTFHPRRS